MEDKKSYSLADWDECPKCNGDYIGLGFHECLNCRREGGFS